MRTPNGRLRSILSAAAAIVGGTALVVGMATESSPIKDMLCTAVGVLCIGFAALHSSKAER